MNKLIIIICLFLGFYSSASHIVGGDVYYDYLGNNQYRFFVSVYRDCNSNGAAFDSPLNFGVFRNVDNSRFNDFQFTFNGSSLVPTNFNNPCGIAPTNICTENAIYSQVITLPPIAGGYRVAYQRCCRGPNINNLINPDDTGLTLSIVVPGTASNNFQNSSPRFVNYPPLVLCNNDNLIFNHSATDPDGDNLVYSLVTPFAGGTSLNPAPNPIPAPNYPFVNWSNGFSATQALGPSSSISIDPVTGVISAFPTVTGRYVVGIQVQEFRNGVLLSSVIRDFIFQVFNCQITLDAVLPLQTQLPGYTGYCVNNLTVNFVNNSFGGSTYAWDFGVPGIITDVSSAFAPSYTYPDTGTYIVKLVVNPGLACRDSTYMTVKLYNELNWSFSSTDTSCLFGNSFNFVPITDAPLTGSTFSWDFGPGSNPATSNLKNPPSVSFSNPGWQYITSTSTFGVCTDTHLDSVYLIPEPIADFQMPFNYECDGLTVDFINTSQNSFNYNWSFGVNNDQSNLFQPSYTFPAGGTYTVQLIASSSALCADTISKILKVSELMTVDFDNSPNQCLIGNSFDFVGTVAGPPSAVFTWDFGNNASIQTSNATTVNGVVFSTFGNQTVTLTGQFDNCITQKDTVVFLFREPTVNFDFVDGIQCAPWRAQFIDLSIADTDISYEWDFGDGSPLDTNQNPSHVYVNPGNYVVTLTIRTNEGCIGTFTVSQPDFINILPVPEASFSVSREQAHICDSEIEFTNTSSGEDFHRFWLDEGATNSNQNQFSYAYSKSGYHAPYIVAYNNEGCSDTALLRIYIEPFSVFVPNAFTPDENEFNRYFKAKMWIDPVEWNMKIYNRWGEMIFETNDYNIGWDGTYQGRIMQTGLYTYKLRYVTCSPVPEEVELTGHVSLVK